MNNNRNLINAKDLEKKILSDSALQQRINRAFNNGNDLFAFVRDNNNGNDNANTSFILQGNIYKTNNNK